MEGLEIEEEEVEGLVGEKEEPALAQNFVARHKRKIVISAIVVLLIIGILSKAPGGRTEELFIEHVVDDVDLVNVNESNENTEKEDKDTRRQIASIPAIPIDRDQLPLDESTKEEMIEKWGQWHFWDGDEDMRPKEDYTAKYPHRDIPGDDFPDEAWQVDAVYVNHYLNDADKLISRAMEAIFTEYGKGKPLAPEKLAERLEMFHWEKLDLKETTSAPPMFSRRGNREIGGWTTKRSFNGLVRRLLHAMMTQDTFTVVLAGHSAAMGAGNHFRQSYMMQFYRVMRPIFDRLGVKLITRNISQGGLGTIQGAMGSAGIYGDEVDLMIWDSGMTEGGAPEHVDLFLRQALIGGNRVPVVWGGNFELLRMLHEEADADVGEFGWATADMPVTENEEQMKDLPWAYQRMKCLDENQDFCKEDRFNATCWIDRPDGIKPETAQLDRPTGQVKWHPGWRSHQLTGRSLAFAVLEALQNAVNIWSEGTMTGQPLDEEYWHVNDYYNNIREKVLNLDKELGACYKIEGKLPTRMCNTPMNGRTQYTPRAQPDERSISALIKPTPDGFVPKNEKVALYDGPDVHIAAFDIPEGAIDVVSIVENRRRRLEETSEQRQVSKSQTTKANQSRNLGDEIVPGKGWQVFGEPQGFCDGTYEAICGRSTDNDCILAGHHDGRGAVIGNEYAGWLVLQLKDVKDGIIVAKLHTWHYENENTRTAGWKTVNDERQLRGEKRKVDGRLKDSNIERSLMRSYETPELPDGFVFDFAINGKITSWNKAQFLDEKKQIQRVVETVTLLDDEDFSNGEAQEVEVAIRLRGCGTTCVFGLSHIYWA